MKSTRLTLIVLISLIFAASLAAQTTAFTYQGRLTDNLSAASGTYQMQFALYDAPTGGTQIGTTIENGAVNVSNGVFTVQIDPGPATFSGADRYLEVRVRRTASESYATLSPRQRITSAPYAVHAANAGLLGGQPAGAFATQGQISSLQTQNMNLQAQIDQLRIELAGAVGGSHFWSKRFGSTEEDRGHSVAVDADGNVYVTGYFNGTVDFGGGPLVSGGSTDVFVAKYSGASGAHLWSKRFGDAQNQYGVGVGIDPAGNVIVGGYFNGAVDFGGGVLTSAGAHDVFIAKLSGSNGAHIWSRRSGGTDVDPLKGFAVGENGDVVISGYFGGTSDYGGVPLVSAGGTDLFVAKYSGTTGAHIWSKRFGRTESDHGGEAVGLDPTGNVYFTGNFEGAINFGGGPLNSAGATDGFLAKLSAADGSHIWSKRFGGVADELGLALKVDPAGNVFMTGSFTSNTVDLGGGALSNVGLWDIIIARFSSAGSHLWSKAFGTTDNDFALDFDLDSAGNPTLGGYFAGSITFGGPALQSAGLRDIFVTKLAGTSGSHVWSKRFGGTAHDYPDGVDVNGADLYITGFFASPTLDLGGGPLTNTGLMDVWVARLKN